MILLLLFSTIFVILSVNLYKSRRKNPRGPFPLPLLGNLHQLIYACWKTGGLVTAFNYFKAEYGAVFTLWLGHWPTVYISDYDVAFESHVKRANEFSARFATGGMDLFTRGMGIILSNGDFWLEHRRFALKTLRDFGVGRNIMEERIMEEFEFRFNEQQGVVNCSTFFEITVGSIINRLIFSERFEREDESFEELRSNMVKSFESLSLLDAFCPKWILRSKWMKWRTEKTFRPRKEILDMLEEKIRKRWACDAFSKKLHFRVAQIESGAHELDEGNDFVDAFLVKMKKDNEEGLETSFSIETLVIDVFDLWTAGQETTTSTLCWACVCLLNRPELIRKVREELVEVTGGSRHVSLTDRPRTLILNAVINEIQRIASILNTIIFRITQNDTMIDGQPLEAGTVFTTQLSMIHTDEKLFRNHTDFKPERFLEDNGLEKKLIPFGIGKRACLGESLARAEIYLILGNLLLNYDLEPVNGKVPPMKSINPFSISKRAPDFDVRFIPVN